MGKKNQSQGCCPDTHAKCFEIILIIGFLLSLIALIVNLILNIWFFKLSIYFLILSIVSIAMGVISIILSIILRMWRSDDSVLKKNFSSSNCVSSVLIALVIINILSSIAEEVLYSFIYNYFHVRDEIKDCYTSTCDSAKIKDLKKNRDDLENIYIKLLNKIKDDEDIDGFDDENKMKLLKLLPWIAFNFNILIQLLMEIFIIILKRRINLKNHFGFTRKDNQSSKSEIIINDNYIYNKNISKKKKKKKEPNGINNSYVESDVTNLKNKKAKKRKKKRNLKK